MIYTHCHNRDYCIRICTHLHNRIQYNCITCTNPYIDFHRCPPFSKWDSTRCNQLRTPKWRNTTQYDSLLEKDDTFGSCRDRNHWNCEHWMKPLAFHSLDIVAQFIYCLYLLFLFSRHIHLQLSKLCNFLQCIPCSILAVFLPRNVFDCQRKLKWISSGRKTSIFYFLFRFLTQKHTIW